MSSPPTPASSQPHLSSAETARAVLERLAARRAATSRYASEKEIARGGMGAILAAEDVDLRRQVAIKVAHVREDGTSASDPQGLYRFLEEAQVTAQLSHPGVVPVHELGLDARGRVFFSMALVQGEDLERVFARVRAGEAGWTQTRVLGVLQRVCETMAYAHSRGVIHRDLKPANVMVGSFGEVYVMDWGLAKLAGSADARDLRPALVNTDRRDAAVADVGSSLLTEDGTIVGTPSYMSPEQAEGRSLDMRTDVYALGAMLYTLLVGQKPYAAANFALSPRQIVAAIQAGPPRAVPFLAPDASLELVAICEKAMARQPGSRYADMREMAEDLRAFLENRVVRAHRTGAWVELVKWVRRNRALAAALAGVVLAAAVGTGAFVLKERERAEAERDGRVRQGALSDLRVATALVGEEKGLWPALPHMLPTIDRWLADARSVLARAPEHHALRARLVATGVPSAVGDPADRIASGSTYATERDAAIVRSVDELAALSSAFEALVRSVEQRHEDASTLRTRTIEAPEAQRRWAAAIEGVAASAVYEGLELRPQVGLLPLRRDPKSGLWEFLHVQSGAEPGLDAERDAWRITPETGIVLVLLPPGLAGVGSIATQKQTALDDYEDPDHESDEAFFPAIALEAFFLSKHETTLGQWRRFGLSTEIPSERAPGDHPVAQISVMTAHEGARRMGLVLPSEVQWEYACRAGTTSVFSTGDAYASLVGYANFADRSLKRLNPAATGAFFDEEDDGFALLAPVGSFSPNAFGLHDLHGNVWEFCADRYSAELLEPPRPGDGLRELNRAEAVLRGGSFFGHPTDLRSANRLNYALVGIDGDLGVRFARRIE